MSGLICFRTQENRSCQTDRSGFGHPRMNSIAFSLQGNVWYCSRPAGSKQQSTGLAWDLSRIVFPVVTHPILPLCKRSLFSIINRKHNTTGNAGGE